MEEVLITICARGGSKGVPDKNIKEVNGKPLIGYTIDFAKKLGYDILLSTDSERISKVAENCGLDSYGYIRPDWLATDQAGKVDVIYNALQFAERKFSKTYDYVLDLDVTSPLRTEDDIKQALELVKSNTEALDVFSVSRAVKNPYFNMVEKNENGFYDLSKSKQDFFSRQSAPEVYELNASFYIYKKAFFEAGYKSPITPKSLAFVMDHECFDIDDELALSFLEFLLKENKLKFTV